MRTALVVCLLTTAALCCGCTAERAGEPRYPAPITHIVLAKLNNPADAPELLKDGRERLAPIPGVLFYAQGPALDVGRAGVDKDYDAAFLMGFRTPDDYQRYIDNPRHQDFVKAWGPRVKWLRIHDVQTAAR